MKAEYDFSKAERGKFYHPDAVFSFPVYLARDVHLTLAELPYHDLLKKKCQTPPHVYHP